MFGDKFKSRSKIFVKICGITNEEDARVAIDAGADALGFNLVPRSKRYLQIDHAASWIGKLPREICKLAIVADPNWEDACRISQLPFVDGLQLHGSESQNFCRRLAEATIPFAKAIPVTGSKSLADLPDYCTDTMIFDSSSGGAFGGSGKVFPWKFAPEFVRNHPKISVIVAGGLNPANVAEAVRVVRPFGVDVTSGVEVSPGRKDPALVRAFMEAAREASESRR
ncbi:MAG TPA: phosphoribosylanthranilate isomerase [Chthoniobacterales bacterium]|jgi:phosphoribosylanthranilate isomerase|nr:phosphoribosylanthranilate isomerase [Chthoniobacterales bacterium]